MAYRAGRHFLQIPGPSPVPDAYHGLSTRLSLTIVAPILGTLGYQY